MLLHAATPAGIHQPDKDRWAGWEGTSRLGDENNRLVWVGRDT